jgi:hypothetical protein
MICFTGIMPLRARGLSLRLQSDEETQKPVRDSTALRQSTEFFAFIFDSTRIIQAIESDRLRRVHAKSPFRY